MVYQLPLHHPIRLAQDAAMLDNLSHGRLEFGAGYGIHAHEFMRWELPFGERRAMGEEVMDIVLKAWTRSEEHTSELQSLRHLVCRLLLEKKKRVREQEQRQGAAEVSGRRVDRVDRTSEG